MLKKVQKTSLVQDIVDQIEEAIVGGTYNPGDKLPSIPNLQEMVGASQGTLREALRVLEQKGLIEIKLGVKGGAYIRESSTDTVTESLALLIRQRKVSMKDLAEFRQVAEAGLIRLVCERVNADDIEKLKQLLMKFQPFVKKGARGWKAFLDNEVDLRKELIRIARNRMYEAVLGPIHENIFAYVKKFLSYEKTAPAEAYADWTQIVTAIAENDVETAVATTREHIARYAKL